MVERDIPAAARRAGVRIKVEACGVCHSDSAVVQGLLPGLQYPRVPGHEVAGVIDALGAGVVGWKRGQRVGVGWHGGYDGTCDACGAATSSAASRSRSPAPPSTAATPNT